MEILAQELKYIIQDNIEDELSKQQERFTEVDVAEFGQSITIDPPAKYAFDGQELLEDAAFPAVVIIPLDYEYFGQAQRTLNVEVEIYCVDDQDYIARVIRRYGKAIANIMRKNPHVNGNAAEVALEKIIFDRIPFADGIFLRAAKVTAKYLVKETDFK